MAILDFTQYIFCMINSGFLEMSIKDYSPWALDIKSQPA